MAFCTKDADLAYQSIQWLMEITPPCPDSALLMCTKSAATLQHGPIIRDMLSRVFTGGVEFVAFFDEDERGRWYSNNFAFRNVAMQVREFKKEFDSFYFYEADCTPLRASWWNELKAEYNSCGKELMGVPRITRLDSGEEKGIHMNGSAFYPRDLHVIAPAVFYLAENIPWDIYNKDWIVPKAHFTRKMQCLFKQDPIADMSKIELDAVIVHGCKDGSLITALRTLGQFNPPRAAAPALVAAPLHPPGHTVPFPLPVPLNTPSVVVGGQDIKFDPQWDVAEPDPDEVFPDQKPPGTPPAPTPPVIHELISKVERDEQGKPLENMELMVKEISELATDKASMFKLTILLRKYGILGRIKSKTLKKNRKPKKNVVVKGQDDDPAGRNVPVHASRD